MKNLPALVEQLKDAGQDYEFYPTSPHMIQTVLDHTTTDEFYDLTHSYGRGGVDGKTVLDVGAGDGRFLQAAKAHEKWAGADLLAVEKSQILINHLVKFAKVIGTDFHAQSFVPKQVDLLYCNPPYREYAAWMVKLVKECPARVMYFVVPERWKDDARIADAVKFREARVVVLGSDDFLDADRKARAKVDILCVAPKRDDNDEESLFGKFFLERFGHLRDNLKQSADKQAEQAATKRAGLVSCKGLIGALTELYDAEMARLIDNYEKASNIDADLLRELGLSVVQIVDTLKAKIDGLKHKYWDELFAHLDTVTRRLTSKNRRAILDQIGGFKAVDFSADNIYAIVLWVIENANQYVDQQILEVFDTLLSHANMQNYKSNARVYQTGKYRYQDEKPTHVSLDFRLVVEGWYGFRTTYKWETERLSDQAGNLVDDILCVANLLGFSAVDNPAPWQPGKPKVFVGPDGKDVVEFKAFKNGNMHVRMSQQLTMALNVAVGKLRGWVRSAAEAEQEIGTGAADAFSISTHFSRKMLNLPGPSAQKDTP